MDRNALEARLSYVVAVRRHLPELADKLEKLGLMAVEDPAAESSTYGRNTADPA